jgi:hypothetical protein
LNDSIKGTFEKEEGVVCILEHNIGAIRDERVLDSCGKMWVMKQSA